MTSADLIRIACERFDRGEFKQTLARRIAHASESQKAGNQLALNRYLTEEIQPVLQAMGFSVRQIAPLNEGHPLFCWPNALRIPACRQCCLTATVMWFSVMKKTGVMGSPPGNWWKKATIGTDAAVPITKASTAST